MRLRLYTCVLAVAALAAGCETEPSVYKAQPTATCLREADYRVVTARAELGVVEGHAFNGGLIAYQPGNAVRIAFGQNEDDARGLERAFTRFVPKRVKPHILDVMRTQKNAVLLWTVTPSVETQDEVFGCLKG